MHSDIFLETLDGSRVSSLPRIRYSSFQPSSSDGTTLCTLCNTVCIVPRQCVEQSRSRISYRCDYCTLIYFYQCRAGYIACIVRDRCGKHLSTTPYHLQPCHSTYYSFVHIVYVHNAKTCIPGAWQPSLLVHTVCV